MFDWKNPGKTVTSLLMLLVGVTIIFSTVVTSLLTNALNNVSAWFTTIGLSGFGGFFSSGGIIYLLIGAGVLIAFIGYFKLKGGK